MRIRKKVAMTEILAGLALMVASSYLTYLSVTDPSYDLHGLVLSVSIFGASLGSLLSFSGIALLKTKHGVIAHAPFCFYLMVTWLAWGAFI